MNHLSQFKRFECVSNNQGKKFGKESEHQMTPGNNQLHKNQLSVKSAREQGFGLD